MPDKVPPDPHVPGDASAPPGSTPMSAPDWDAPSAPAPPTGLGLPVWAIAGAVILGSALVLAAMAWPSRRASSRASSAVEGSAAGPAASVPVPHNGWTAAHADRWTGGRKRSVAWELEATNSVTVWMKHVRPVLVVRCLANHADAFVFTDAPASIEPDPDTRTVRVALDTAEPSWERWVVSAGHDGLFAPDTDQFLERLSTAGRLDFGFTPQNAPAVIASFDLTGVDRVLGDVRAACRRRR
jgi:hypothetical protein